MNCDGPAELRISRHCKSIRLVDAVSTSERSFVEQPKAG
jgi:hypothetical protein